MTSPTRIGMYSALALASLATASPRVVLTVVAKENDVSLTTDTLPPTDSAYYNGLVRTTFSASQPTISPNGIVAFSAYASFEEIATSNTTVTSGRWLWSPATEQYTVISDGLSDLEDFTGDFTAGSVSSGDSPVFIDRYDRVAFYKNRNIYTDALQSGLTAIAEEAEEVPGLSSDFYMAVYPGAENKRLAVNDRGDIAFEMGGSSSNPPDYAIYSINSANTSASFTTSNIPNPASSPSDGFSLRFSTTPGTGTDWTSLATSRYYRDTNSDWQFEVDTATNGSTSTFSIPDPDDFNFLRSITTTSDGDTYVIAGSATGVDGVRDGSGLLIEDGTTTVDGATVDESFAVVANTRGDVVVHAEISDSTNGSRNAFLVRRPSSTFSILVDESDSSHPASLTEFLMLDGLGNIIFAADQEIWFADTNGTVSQLVDRDATTINAYQGGAPVAITPPTNFQVYAPVNGSSDSARQTYEFASTEDGRPRWMTHDSLQATFTFARPHTSGADTAHVFHADIFPCSADLNKDGVLDLSDTTAFTTAFSAQDPLADFASPYGVYDLSDISAFTTAFNAGCP